MRRRPLILVLLATALLSAGAVPETACGQRLTAAPRQRALCCCRTWGGGSCCAYVTLCTGVLIPGCLCQ